MELGRGTARVCTLVLLARLPLPQKPRELGSDDLTSVDHRQSRKHWSVLALTTEGSECLAGDHRLRGWLGSTDSEGPWPGPMQSSLPTDTRGRLFSLINIRPLCARCFSVWVPIAVLPGLKTVIIPIF